MAFSIMQAYDENILNGITPTGTAPSSSYSLATFLAQNPAARILWGTTSVTITWTLGGSMAGAILVIPCCNLVGSVLALTNGAGLNVPVPIPTMTRNRIPKTIVFDFSASGNLTSNVWNLVITSNVSNVVFGGAVAIYAPKGTLLETDFLLEGGSEEKMAAVQDVENIYLTRYRQVLRTQKRSITLSRVMSQAEELKFSNIYDANFGTGFPGLLWPHPSEEDAYFGTWPATYKRDVMERNPASGRIYRVELKFDELSKGQPV